jgi:hypothetical protein
MWLIISHLRVFTLQRNPLARETLKRIRTFTESEPLGTRGNLVKLKRILFTAILAIGVSSARAQFSLGSANQFAVIYDGTAALQINNPPNVPVTGNIGITSGQFQPSGNIFIPGNVEFSGTPNPATAPGGATYGGTYTGGNASVSSAVTSLNTLAGLISTAGTSQNINGNTTINASSGTLVGGNEIFTISGLNLGNGQTLTINGLSSQHVVLNFPSSLGGLHFSGAITLTGGITSDEVLFNIDNDMLQTAANGATQAGTFLDNGGTINVNSYNLDGRLFGINEAGNNMIITSGASVSAPATPPVPDGGSSMLLMGLGLVFLGVLKKASSAA